VVQRDMAFVQDQWEACGGLLGEQLANHPGQARAQGDHIRGMALVAASIEGQAPLLIDDPGQRDLAQVRAPLLGASSLGETGPAVAGMDEGRVMGGVIDQELRPQGEALRELGQQRLLDAGHLVSREQVQVVPATPAVQLRRGSGHQAGAPRAPGPCGEGPLAFGPDGAVDGRQGQGVPDRQRGPPSRRSWRDLRVDQLDEPQLLGQGIQQGRGPQLPDLHGVELGELVGCGGGGDLGTDLLSHPLPGAQGELLDDARVAVDPARADPVEVGVAFFPWLMLDSGVLHTP
jgi:hypothetical protein